MDDIRDIDVIKTFTLQSTLNFTRYFFKKLQKRRFVVGTHHIKIAQALDRVLRGETTRLIINIAPRYGKTELAVKNFIAMGLALNPKAKFIHLSYSADLARDNSRGVQAILRDSSYRRLFFRYDAHKRKRWQVDYERGRRTLRCEQCWAGYRLWCRFGG